MIPPNKITCMKAIICQEIDTLVPFSKDTRVEKFMKRVIEHNFVTFYEASKTQN